MSRMTPDLYGESYWEGGIGSEYYHYADDPGWNGILLELESFVPPPAVIRELGSAHGYFIKHAREWGFDAEGIDISDYAVKTGLQRMPTLEGKLHLGTVSNPLPWADESADVVFSSEFLEHVAPEEERHVLSEMLRITKSGGLWLHKIGIIVPENHPHRPATVEDHSAHNSHFHVKTREQWNDQFHHMGLIEVTNLVAALDIRFADRDWVMRFFAHRVP